MSVWEKLGTVLFALMLIAVGFFFFWFGQMPIYPANKTGDDDDITSETESTRGYKKPDEAAKALKQLEKYEVHVKKSTNLKVKQNYWEQRIYKENEAKQTTSSLALVSKALADVTTPSQTLRSLHARELAKTGQMTKAAQKIIEMALNQDDITPVNVDIAVKELNTIKIQTSTRKALINALLKRPKIDTGQTKLLYLAQRLQANEKALVK